MVFYMQTAVRPTINAIYGGMCMKKIIAIVMTLVMVLMPTISAFGEEPDLQKLTAKSSVGDFDAAFPTDFQYRSEYEDEFGNNGYIQFSIIGDNSYVEVYVNGELTQRAYSSSKDNIVLWQEYGTSEQRMHDKSEDLKSDLYTDYISDDVSMDKNPEVSVQSDFISFDPEGWSYITTRPSNPTITGSRPCAIYCIRAKCVFNGWRDSKRNRGSNGICNCRGCNFAVDYGKCVLFNTKNQICTGDWRKTDF